MNHPGRIYLGVDQTGAVARRSNGSVYKPLPAAIAIPLNNATIELRAATKEGIPLRLATFDAESIALTLSMNGIKGGETIALIDCVLGLPSSMRRRGKSLRSLLARASRFDATTEIPAGRKRAAAFFHGLLEESGCRTKTRGKWPLRHCEKLTMSNSVFQEHPFQKNIQSGTYRIWCDLGRALEANQGAGLRFWPHDFINQASSEAPKGKRAMIVAEGYPSLYWRKIFGLTSRQPGKLRHAVTRTMKQHGWTVACRDWALVESDRDLADATVLALAALVMNESREIFSNFDIVQLLSESSIENAVFSPGFEGWIAGAQADFFTAS